MPGDPQFQNDVCHECGVSGNCLRPRSGPAGEAFQHIYAFLLALFPKTSIPGSLPPPPSSPIPADRASARLPKAEPPQRTMPRKPTFGCMGALRDQSATNLGFSGLGPGRRLASSAQCAEASPVAMGQNWTAGHAPQPRGHAAATLGDEHHTSVAAEVPSRILPIRSPDLPSRPTPCRQDGLP